MSRQNVDLFAQVVEDFFGGQGLGANRLAHCDCVAKIGSWRSSLATTRYATFVAENRFFRANIGRASSHAVAACGRAFSEFAQKAL